MTGRIIDRRELLRGLAAAGVAALPLAAAAAPAEAGARWTAARANAWHAGLPWLVGANYAPAYAVNQLEMWQADSFDLDAIDRELALAQSIGMNTMRVFLHDLLWDEDAAGFKQRLDRFLTVSAARGIRPMLVFFDSCWRPYPIAGPQPPPIPGYHNSGWLQSPGLVKLPDRSTWPGLRAYVEDITRSFGRDDRVLVWDLWNEPDNAQNGRFPTIPRRVELVTELLGLTFGWMRALDPSQPLTSGVWSGEDWSRRETLTPLQRLQLDHSDVLSFHDYSGPARFRERIAQLKGYGRPLLCTEYLARSTGSTVESILPIALKERVGMFNWGLVDGKTQTRLPWDSWTKAPYVGREPDVWFHELFRADGTPYRREEVELISRLTAQANGAPARSALNLVPD